MNDNHKDIKEYLSPAVRTVLMTLESVLCGSPQAGGLEDIGYDDWGDTNQ